MLVTKILVPKHKICLEHFTVYCSCFFFFNIQTVMLLLQEFALHKLNSIVNDFWAEISGSVDKM